MTPQQLFMRHSDLARYWKGDEHFIALEGLWRAANKCDPARAATFRTYAFACMRGAVLENRRTSCPAPRRAHSTGRTVEQHGSMGWAPADTPTPEELLLEKERILLTRRAVVTTFGHEGALLRATLLEHEHQHIARRRGISKSWASRINARAELRLGRQLRELRA